MANLSGGGGKPNLSIGKFEDRQVAGEGVSRARLVVVKVHPLMPITCDGWIAL